MMTNQCKQCLHLRTSTENLTCDAFPDGIPIDILTGQFDHNKKHENDNGIRFLSGT